MNVRSLYMLSMLVSCATIHAMEKEQEPKILTGYGPFDATSKARVIQGSIVLSSEKFPSAQDVYQAINGKLDNYFGEQRREVSNSLCRITSQSGTLWTAAAALYIDHKKREEEDARRQELYARLKSGEREPKRVCLGDGVTR